MICRASWPSSESQTKTEGDGRGGNPDFESSPEVLTCRKTLIGEVRSDGMALFRAVATLGDVRVWMA